MPEQTEPGKADGVEPESTEPAAVESVEPESTEPASTDPVEADTAKEEATEAEDTSAAVEPEAAESADDDTESNADEATVDEPTEAEPETADPETADPDASAAEASAAEPDAAAADEATDEPEADKTDSEGESAQGEPAQAEAEGEETETAPEPAEPTESEPPDSESEPQPEVAAATADTTTRPDARRKVLQVLTARPGRAQIPVAILLGVLAFGVVVQGRTVSDSGDFAGARRGDLIQLLDSLDATRDRAETQLQDLQSKKRELQNSSTRTQVALQDARDEASTLAILSGTVGATGPGIEIRIDDPANQVGASTLLNVIEELRDAGAEAIEINNTARVVAQTYLADDTDGISVDGTVVNAPFTIDVIGHPHTLSEAVEFPGGVTEIVESLGGSVDVNERETVNVTSLAVRREPQYAQPAE